MIEKIENKVEEVVAEVKHEVVKVEDEVKSVVKKVEEFTGTAVKTAENFPARVERDLIAEFDALKARFEKLLGYLKHPHGIHFPE